MSYNEWSIQSLQCFIEYVYRPLLRFFFFFLKYFDVLFIRVSVVEPQIYIIQFNKIKVIFSSCCFHFSSLFFLTFICYQDNTDQVGIEPLNLMFTCMNMAMSDYTPKQLNLLKRTCFPYFHRGSCILILRNLFCMKNVLSIQT